MHTPANLLVQLSDYTVRGRSDTFFFLSEKKLTTMCTSLKILWVYLLTRSSLGEWIEIAQPLSKPPRPQTAPTTPMSFPLETHATVATENTKNQNESAEERTSGKLFLQEGLDEQILAKEELDGDFIPYLRNIQSTLMKHSHRNVDGKVSLLQNLKDNLLFNISEQITNLWNPPKERRQARDLYDSGDYHMDFPSNEGALMTIGFLTFAVFLIKLVLKLIQSLKNKNNGTNGMTTVTTAVGRKRREIADEEAVKILHWIEEYKFQ